MSALRIYAPDSIDGPLEVTDVVRGGLGDWDQGPFDDEPDSWLDLSADWWCGVDVHSGVVIHFRADQALVMACGLW